jgi:predicted DCC family thiol-disulfide oxidoreductase YuxK
MNIIYFDGECGLCNGFIDFIMRIDKNQQFKFSPLQSDFAKTHLPSQFTDDLKTVVVQIDGVTLKKSQAVLAVFKKIGGFWKALSWLKILPTAFSNHFYDLVAENRYNLFGKKDTCRLPSPEEKQRFIL